MMRRFQDRIVGGQAYHFNMANVGDSRAILFNKHIEIAKELCARKKRNNSDPVGAATNVGIGLHAKQDISAHGDFGKGSPYNIEWHNMDSPQKDYGLPQLYPDNLYLDAKGDPNGVPQGLAIRREMRALNDFWEFLNSDNCSCKCKKYFGTPR